MTTHDFFKGTVFKSVESDEVVYRFTCKKCSGWWNIDSHKNWTPTSFIVFGVEKNISMKINHSMIHHLDQLHQRNMQKIMMKMDSTHQKHYTDIQSPRKTRNE